MEDSEENSELPELETLIRNHGGQIAAGPYPDSQWYYCKPKLLPLKTFTVEKLEKLQHEAEKKLDKSAAE